MKRRWQFVLPVLGLLLFAAVTVHSVRWNRERNVSSRYFWWSSLRLDKDPLGRLPDATMQCQDTEPLETCGWDPPYIIVDPGWIPRLLILTAFPAFAVGMLLVGGLGRVGVNQLWSFMIAMPILIGCWFYFVGWLIDWFFHRRRSRRLASRS
jgi:hypothetical protein